MPSRARRISFWFWMLDVTACSVTAVTKTTGMITRSRRVFGSRNRGNGMFCLVSVWFIPPVVYASGLHQTRRSAHATSAYSNLVIKRKSSANGRAAVPSRACRLFIWFWKLDVTACSVTNPLCRGGPLWPPAPDGFSFGFGCWVSLRVRLQILCVGADRRVRP